MVPDDVGEWDWVIEHNGAQAGTNYCFRMVESDDTLFFAYGSYPSLITDQAPNAATLSVLFDNEQVASSSPWFEFSATDPEGQDLHYQIQIDDNDDFSSTADDKTTISAGSQFSNLTTPADKEPYNDGELIRFKTQVSLTDNTTYWWRVRARDPDGSDSWGAWSSSRSFTASSTTAVSTWFQTTDEQFETNILTGVATTGADSVNMTAVPDVGILDSFSTGNTKTISAGDRRLLLVGIHSEDSGTNVDGNTVPGNVKFVIFTGPCGFRRTKHDCETTDPT